MQPLHPCSPWCCHPGSCEILYDSHKILHDPGRWHPGNPGRFVLQSWILQHCVRSHMILAWSCTIQDSGSHDGGSSSVVRCHWTGYWWKLYEIPHDFFHETGNPKKKKKVFQGHSSLLPIACSAHTSSYAVCYGLLGHIGWLGFLT